MTISEKKARKTPSALLRFFLYALSGALCALPIAVPTLWFVGWIAPAPVLYLELNTKREKDSYLRAYGRGMSFFWFFGVVVFYWFSELYPLDFLGFDKTSALITVILAVFGIPLLQSIVSSFVFVFICFVRKRGFAEAHPIFSAIFTASLFTVSEFMHTLTWLGVPWGRFAVGQVGCLANLQSASLFGSYFITFIMVLVSSLLATSIKHLKKKNRKKAAVSSALALLVFLSNFTFGAVKMAIPEKEGEEVTVAALQGNIRFEDKWADKASYTMDVYRALSLSAAEDGAELIIMPETALPYDISESYVLENYFSEIGTDTGCDVIVTTFETEDEKLYNTARLVSPDGALGDTVYKKRHLVPFGEYIPMENFIRTVFPPLAELSSMMEQVSPGDATALFETENGKVGSLICFDSIYEDLCIESVRDGAGLIAIYTNDSWFSGSAALSQHNAQAQLRAIENGRYVVRAANTGISSVISPNGEIITCLGDNEEGYITADVSFIEENTLYTNTGNLFVALSVASVLVIAVLAVIENKKREKAK